MPAVGDQTRGGGGVRLLHEAGDGVHAGRVAQWIAALDIAVAGFRPGRPHAEGDEPAGAGGRRGDPKRAVQRGDIGDGMVGGQHPQQAVRDRPRPPAGRRRRSRGRCCGRPAPAPAARRRRRRRAIARRSGSGAPGCRPRSAARSRAARAQRGLLHQGAVGHQRPKLLREALARDRPQARAGAAGQDDGDDSRLPHAAGSCPKRQVCATATATGSLLPP